jgi:hypothetical protein
MTIRGFRLNTGEIVLTQVTSRDNGKVSLKDPAQMVMQEIEPGRAGVALQAFIPYGANVLLYETNITAEFDVDQQVQNEYNRLFGSGIQIVGADALAGLQM